MKTLASDNMKKFTKVEGEIVKEIQGFLCIDT